MLALGGAEGGLRLGERVGLGDRTIEDQHLLTDPELAFRLAPYSRGHDANGFRNHAIPERFDVVAIGDSQTWGVNVERTRAWPQQLAALSGRSVYNMGFGGYGPVQYLVLGRRAVTLSPRIIVVGLYLGNDLYDAYKLAYTNEKHREWRDPVAPGDWAQDTVGSRAQVYWDHEKSFHREFERRYPSRWSYRLRAGSAIGRSLTRAGLWPGDVDYEIDRAWAVANPDKGAVCERAGVRTVFTTAYRLVGLDLREPRIREGLRITKVLLARLSRAVDANGGRLLILLIPTKEMVYAEAFKADPLDPTYARLVTMETEARKTIEASCRGSGLQCVDALPKLSAALRANERLYPTTTEGHPMARGYDVLAATVNEVLTQLPR